MEKCMFSLELDGKKKKINKYKQITVQFAWLIIFYLKLAIYCWLNVWIIFVLISQSWNYLKYESEFYYPPDLLTTWEFQYPHLEQKPTQNYQFTSLKLWCGKLLLLPLLFYCFLKIISLVQLSQERDRYGEICPKKRFLHSLQQQRNSIP